MTANLLKLSSAEDSVFREVGLAKELWAHQRAALEYIARARRVLLADEVGVGKTASAIAAVELMRCHPVLVIPPAYLKYTWKRAIDEWTPGCNIRVVEPGEPLIIPGTAEDPDFFIVSYNLLGQQDRDENGEPKDGPNHLVRALLRKPIQTIICDEAHALKTTTSLRQKAVLKLAKHAKLRILIGANPVESKPRELIPQLDILDQLDAFGGKWRFLQHYCNRYGENVKKPGRFGKWDFNGARNLDELNIRLRSICMVQRDKAQVHKSLPPLTQARIDLPISNRKEYEAAQSDFLGWLKENAKTYSMESLIAMAMIKMNVLKQLASVGKREAVSQWVDGFFENNPGQKLVLFTYLRDTADYFSMKYDAPAIVGGTDIKKRELYIAAFQDPTSATRLIIVNVAAGGTGIELYAASNCAFLELDAIPTTHSQAAGRLHRPGQTQPVTAWWLLADRTVEQRIFEDILVPKARIVHDTVRGAGAEAGGSGNLLEGMLRQLIETT